MSLEEQVGLEERRKAAIEADKCFSISTLKDEYRMKPVPGAEAVKFYKSRYGSQYGVYKISDCVPMREKRVVTEKQIEAGKALGELSKKNSKRGQAATKAQALLAADPLIIDTETTGLDLEDQVIEIAVVDVRGQVLFETRLRPSVPIHPEAQGVHGVSIEALADAPTWPQIATQLKQLLEDRPVVAFNHDFDQRLLQQTAKAFGDDYHVWNIAQHCAMRLAAQALGATNRHGSISLARAVYEAGIEWQGQAHSAAGDALTTLAVVKAIAAYP